MIYFLQAVGGQGGGMIQLVIFGLIFLVFYFFFIRPQAKKQKAQNTFITEIKKGDEIVTNSGIIGKVNRIDDNIVQIQIDQKTFVKVLKSAISKELTDSLNKSEA